MENFEQNDVAENNQSFLHSVTPLAKYLAMALFVALPFIGGWIGYTYMPEKVVEVEKVKVSNNNSEPQHNTDVLQERIDILSLENKKMALLVKKLQSITALPYPGAPLENTELKSTLANSIITNFTCEDTNEYVSLRKDVGHILFNQIDFSAYTDTDLGFVIKFTDSCQITPNKYLGLAYFSQDSEAGSIQPHQFFFLYDSDETILAVSEPVVIETLFDRFDKNPPSLEIDGATILVKYGYGDAGHFTEQSVEFDVSNWSITDVKLNAWSAKIQE